jgi:glycerophosphoryl diester phosphodiesterase
MHESLRDTWGRLRWGETWSDLKPLPGLDYGWLDDLPRPLMVAHALGDAGGPLQNTLAALDVALAAGSTLLEVDLWLDGAGRLRCHHGPEPPTPFREGDCEFDGVLDRLTGTRVRVVLDIKTDFAATGERVVSVIAARGAGSRVVFQLYAPKDVELFARWMARTALSGPIVTAYRSHRGLDEIAAQAKRLGIRAVVVPLYRLPALGLRGSGLALFVHPVHDCQSAQAARRGGGEGLFVTMPLLRSRGSACNL